MLFLTAVLFLQPLNIVFILNVCMFCLHMYLGTTFMPVPEEARRGIDYLEVELQTVVRCCVEADNQTWVLRRNSRCPSPLTHLSSSSLVCLIIAILTGARDICSFVLHFSDDVWVWTHTLSLHVYVFENISTHSQNQNLISLIFPSLLSYISPLYFGN